MTTRFTVEETLGKLAKWLRILGFDACSEPCGSIGSKAAAVSGRILLTRTRRRCRELQGRPFVFIHSNDPFDQLKEVIMRLGSFVARHPAFFALPSLQRNHRTGEQRCGSPPRAGLRLGKPRVVLPMSPLPENLLVRQSHRTRLGADRLFVRGTKADSAAPWIRYVTSLPSKDVSKAVAT